MFTNLLIFRSASVVLISMTVVSACSEKDTSSIVVDLGVIEATDRLEPAIDHPAIAQRQADISVTVMTYGNDCTWMDRTEVEVHGLDVVIRPFDRSDTESPCGDTIFGYPHLASVRFEQAGTATITVLGYGEGDRFGTVIERSSSLEIQ